MGLSGGAQSTLLSHQSLAVWGSQPPPSRSLGLAAVQPGSCSALGMQTLAFIEGKRLRLHEALPWMPRHPIKGCSTETKCVGVLFPLSPRSPSRFGLGLSTAVGSSQPHPLRREHEHLQMWFARNTPQ